VEETFDAVIT